MSSKQHFYYADETCDFVPLKQKRTETLLFLICQWILNGVVVSTAGLIVMVHLAGTPAELVLREENEALIQKMDTIRNSILILESTVEAIAVSDNELYRSVLELAPVSFDELSDGTGGTDPYAAYDLYSEEAAEVLRWTSQRINSLENRIKIRAHSLVEVTESYFNRQQALRTMPAMKPVNGISLSGYGMRIHPVLNYRRMHHGVDFRARIGTPVYATGDGVVKRVGRRGSYGYTVILEHEDGYETWYAHLSGFADGIAPGRRVNRGEKIGASGNSGMTQGPHLHYEVRHHGQSVDPVRYLIEGATPEEYNLYTDVRKADSISSH